MDTNSELSVWTAKSSDFEPFLWHSIHREYWRRAWIVQEIGSASSIDVYFGSENYHKLSWDEFVALLKIYQANFPLDVRVNEVLRFEDLRKSRFETGEAYSLASLLSLFADSFCQDPRDKIYAFLGIADDTSDTTSVLPIDYNHSIAKVYADTMTYFSGITADAEKKEIQAVYLSTLVRRLLFRKSGSVTIDERLFKSGISKNSGTYWYMEDQKKRRGEGTHDEAGTFLFVFGFFRILDFFCWLWEPGTDEIRTKTVMYWRQSGRENAQCWQIEPRGPRQGDFIRLRGLIAGVILHSGPTYNEVTDRGPWPTTLPVYVPAHNLGAVRVQNKRLMKILYDYVDIIDILTFPGGHENYPSNESLLHKSWKNVPLEQDHEHQDFLTNSWLPPRIFIATNGILGVSAPSAMEGDLVVQFWKSSVSAIIRRLGNETYQIIARSGVVQKGKSLKWDVPQDERLFAASSPNSIQLTTDLDTLTQLSLNSFNFEESTNPSLP